MVRNISKETLTSAVEMFIFLNFCPRTSQYDDYITWIRFYQQLFLASEPRIILMTLNRLLKTPQGKIALKLLQHVGKVWNLELGKNLSDFAVESHMEMQMEMVYQRNHPVHIIDSKRKINPSSLIPFCEIGGNMSVMGSKVDNFDVPVCNSFQARILNDQLCYEVDPNEFVTFQNIGNVFKTGLVLLIDYNEDRQVIFEDSTYTSANNLVGKFEKALNDKEMMIYLSTVGMYLKRFSLDEKIDTCEIVKFVFNFRTFKVVWRRSI